MASVADTGTIQTGTIQKGAAQNEAAGGGTKPAIPFVEPTADRIQALDFVRGAALFGILLMNITGFGLSSAYDNPVNNGGATGANLWAWIIIQVGFEGTQRAIFSMLFGAGVILFTSRLEAKGRADSADIYFRRNLWLIALGMINAWVLLWMGDILYAYGIAALFIYAFRKMAAKHLLTIGLVVLMLCAAWNAKDTYSTLAAHAAAQQAQNAKASGAKLTEAQSGAIAAWDEKVHQATPPQSHIKADIAKRNGSWWGAAQQIGALNLYMQSWFLYREFGDIFGMMLIGMALFRFGVLTLERPTRLYVAMLVLGYSVGFAVNITEVQWILSHNFSLIAFEEAGISYDLGRLSTAMGHLGLLLLFVRSGIFPLFRHALASVGQMALTNYLTHSTVCAILFIGLGWYGQLERHQLYYVVFSIWTFQIVFSPLWLKTHRFGPVEWVWRSLTYMKAQPMRRMVASA